MRFLIIFMIFASLLEAQYLRTIRIGTYPNESSAIKALEEIQKYTSSNPTISNLQKEWDFTFKERKSGKYYITLAEPFRDRDVLQQVLDNLRLVYPDIYVTRLKSAPAFKKTTKKEDEHKDKVKADVVLNKEPITVEKPFELIHKKIISENSMPNSKKEESYIVYILAIILLIFLILTIVFFRLFRRYKKSADDLGMQNMILEEQLEQEKRKLKNKDKVFSHTSHELRNPMSAIIGLSHLLLEESMSLKQKEYVKKINGSAKYILEIINDILDISKMEAGALKIEKREFNINHVIKHVVNIVSVAARENGTRVELDIHRNVPPYIIGDSLRLTQILINLLSNAVKFTKNGLVTLSIRKASQHGKVMSMEFVVKDNGIGMTETQLKNIFVSYTQESESIAREYGGTGLGLSIVKYLIDIMNGDIQVESKKQHGTTFVVHLQFNTFKADEKRFYRLPSKKYLNKRVLIVEKSQSNVDKLKEAFNYFHYIVHTIPSFDDIVFDANIRFDIVIINKDQADSKVIATVKQMQEENKTKFILFSNSILEVDKKLLDTLEIDGHLNRPFTQADVLELLKNVCNEDENIKKISKESLPKEKLKSLSKKKILIAEDNRLNHKVLTEILAGTPLELKFVENGQEALDVLKTTIIKFDLIILDINMPKLNGYETALEIRKNKKYKDVPILALTADVMQESIDKAYEVGMQGHIAKPVIINTFYEKLYNVLSDSPSILLSHNKEKADEHLLENEGFAPSNVLNDVHDDDVLYRSLLEDFQKLYKSSALEIKQLLNNGKFKEARKKAIDIKEVAFNIGAYKLCENAADMQYVFEKGSRGNYMEILNNYQEALSDLLKEIEHYLQS